MRAKYLELLDHLLTLNTVTPLESRAAPDSADRVCALEAAFEAFRGAAAKLGFERVFLGAGEVCAEIPPHIKAICEADATFLKSQPSMVLGLNHKPGAPADIMFNFHMDTVGPHLESHRREGTIFGRGAIDNKGPGVALLDALETWLGKRPDVAASPSILIQCVSGEEGGAMGTYGTLGLMRRQYWGRLNVFVIPSEMKYYDASTASMTVKLRVDGDGVTDDNPTEGDNATLILSEIVVRLRRIMAPVCRDNRVKFTIAGIKTGEMHNRVYGEGMALMNFSYRSRTEAEAVEAAFARAYARVIDDIVQEYRCAPGFTRVAERVDRITSFCWLKRGLPALSNRDAAWEALLSSCGIERNVEGQAFTCDAIWGAECGGHTIMFGPGSLEENGAHTPDEHIAIGDLSAFSDSVAALLSSIDRTLCSPDSGARR